MPKIAIVGIGQWGKNLIRCFEQIVDVEYCCHTGSIENANWFEANYPNITLTDDYDKILQDDNLDAVVIATPISTHAALAKRALKANHHVFVEKPLAESAEKASELVEIAVSRELCLFTGYVFLYTPAMQRLRQLTNSDEDFKMHFTWEKYGSFDSPIEYSLVCHDIAIAKHLYEESIKKAKIINRSGVQTNADILLSAYKTERGNEFTTFYDRTSRINRKSIIVITESGSRYEISDDILYELQDDTHENRTPKSDLEPLLAECKSFIQWIEGGDKPPSGGRFGAEINEILEML